MKYTSQFKAVYKNDNLEERVMVMGCYGIGVSRTLQAVIEQSHDANGIIWPASVAPFQVCICLLDPDNPEAVSVAEAIEKELESRGVDAIVDDRSDRPGVKFKDADLIGFPVRVVVGTKGLSSGGVEIKRRRDDKSATVVVSPDKAVDAIMERLA